ncbi:MAG: tRNA preQ1(34) S-adenosylmethionine ribosyltransferase-isomerase QueA [Deltaproteobacteria bacterium]|nr:tRNA preQ1(34) S-adenosylmethionine ribosyltransferase-isomerase QueA [Deltaproteobacteria bacterium]
MKKTLTNPPGGDWQVQSEDEAFGTSRPEVLPEDYDLHSYLYDLPEELVAQVPSGERSGSRLLVLERGTGTVRDAMFSQIANLLPRDCLLVMNNTAVLPARLIGRKSSGARAEFLLLTPLALIPNPGEDAWTEAEVEALIRTSRARIGTELEFGSDCTARLMAPSGFGRWTVSLRWRGNLADVFLSVGHVPLPPYIRREDSGYDRLRYQTVYARKDKLGSVAAPTAGLHFTHEAIAGLEREGLGLAEVTLYVGYGTFSPIRTQDVRDHRMHEEFVEIPEETAEAVNRARSHGRPVVAVGTTSVRSLESAAGPDGLVHAFQGWTDKYIVPGYKFQTIDHLITNFHLPGSSLMLLVSALAGRKKILAAYRHAVADRYRFFSYGDAMLVL